MTDKPEPSEDPPEAQPADVAETDPEMLRVLFDHEMERSSSTRIVRGKRRLRPLPRQ